MTTLPRIFEDKLDWFFFSESSMGLSLPSWVTYAQCLVSSKPLNSSLMFTATCLRAWDDHFGFYLKTISLREVTYFGRFSSFLASCCSTSWCSYTFLSHVMSTSDASTHPSKLLLSPHLMESHILSSVRPFIVTTPSYWSRPRTSCCFPGPL